MLGVPPVSEFASLGNVAREDHVLQTAGEVLTAVARVVLQYANHLFGGLLQIFQGHFWERSPRPPLCRLQ